MWIPVKLPGGERLAFKYDPVRELIQLQVRNEKHTFDLRSLRGEWTDADIAAFEAWRTEEHAQRTPDDAPKATQGGVRLVAGEMA